MNTNPFYNALFAVAYIVGIITIIFFSNSLFNSLEETIFVPMAMLSLFVFSAAIMAFLFFYQPIMILLDGKREKAVKFFLKTIGFFALITLVIFFISIIIFGLF